MQKAGTYSRHVILLTIALGILLLSQCIQKKEDGKKVAKTSSGKENPPVFTGSAACKTCHAAIYESHLRTFHHLTSSVASPATVKGSFDSRENKFYFDPVTFIAAEKNGDSLFQTAYKRSGKIVSRPFNFAIGSGKRGQTFLYWYGTYLFQLPLTYFTATGEWTNSPGYAKKVEFSRPITARCLECHSTYFKQESDQQAKADEFSKDHIVLGIECERCHGPAGDHVLYQQQHPQDSTAHFIVNTGKLSRQQNLDLCRFCHGGHLEKSTPSFSFPAGGDLDDYFSRDTVQHTGTEIDVHGNQFGMLKASKCFTGSKMDCLTCHNVHENESDKEKLVIFAQKCLQCHDDAGGKLCKLTTKTNALFLKNNCIDCHMPEQPSKTIVVLRPGDSIPTSARMRSHYISVYKEESARIEAHSKLR